MIEMIEKTLLAGVGALSLSQKKADEFLDEIKERMNLSEEEGRSLLEKIKKTADESRERLEQIAREEVEKSMERIGVVPRKDYDALEKRVKKLEKALKESKH